MLDILISIAHFYKHGHVCSSFSHCLELPEPGLGGKRRDGPKVIVEMGKGAATARTVSRCICSDVCWKAEHEVGVNRADGLCSPDIS
jgi:hypothetical protein